MAQERILTTFVDKQQNPIVVPMIGFKLWYFTNQSTATIVQQDDIQVCVAVQNAPIVSSAGRPQAEWASIWQTAPKLGAQVLKIWWDFRQDKDVDKIKKKRYYADIRTQRDHYWYDPTTNEFGTASSVPEIPRTAESVAGVTIKDPVYRFLYDLAYNELWPDWIPVEP